MKRVTVIFSWALIMMACNNSGSSNANGNSDTGNVSEKKQAGEPAKSADATGCSRLVFFQQGAEVEATTFNEDGKEVSKQYTKILAVSNEGGQTVANVEGRDMQTGVEKEAKTVNYSYKCDGNKIYFDIASMFRTDEKNADATFESSFIEYPINLAEGETLPDATGSMSSSRSGKKMTIHFKYKDRKVDRVEKITTAAGTWNCYKITNEVEAEMDYPGMDEKTKEMMKSMKAGQKTTTATWFSPDFGIVKMEMYLNGKLSSRNEVTAVKK